MFYLRIPAHQVIDFDFAKFADHVLDHSPVYETRAVLRLGYKARDAIAEADGGIAEMGDDVGELFQRACEHAPFPRLLAQRLGASGQPFGDPEPIPKSAFEPFYEAAESMTKERPEAALATAAE